MSRNEKTSVRVARNAAKVLAMKPHFDNVAGDDGVPFKGPEFCLISRREWRDIRALAASAFTQTADKPRRKRERHVGESLRNFTPPSEWPKRKRKRVTGPARIRSKRPSSWPPSAKPSRRSP